MKGLKFRAWNTEDKKMNYVDDKNILVVYSERKWSLGVPSYGWGMENETNQDTGILMQYTGLQDKNGVEIYEGDIFRYVKGEDEVRYLNRENEEIHQVIFKEGMFQNDFNGLRVSFYMEGKRSIEVIGNIYENPELLERLER